jgi:O-antigen ligase
MIIAAAAILLWFLGVYLKAPRADEDRPSPAAILLAVWVIACAVFHTVFFTIKAPGLPDISLERMIFVAVILFIVVGWFQGKVRFDRNISIEILMGLFVILCGISMIRFGFVAVTPEFQSPWFTFITGYFFPFIVFVFAKNFIFREKDLSLILHALFYFGVYLSVMAFFEYMELRQFVFPRYINDPEVGIHITRARGPFLNAAYNGVGILVGFVSGLHLLEKKKGFSKFFHQAALLLFFPAVFFTLTRSVYLGLIISLFLFLGWYKTSFSKWRLISLPLAIVLIVAIVNSPRLLSTERREGGVAQVQEVDIRIALMKKSFYMFTERPLAGVGLGQFVPTSLRSYKGPIYIIEEYAVGTFQHNHLLGVATEMGLIGIAVYLSLVFVILRRLAQLAGRLPATGIMGNNLRVTILAIWCVYLNNNLFVEPANNLFVNAVPFLFAGLADGMYTRSLQAEGLMGAVQSDPSSRQPSMRLMTRHV